MSMITESLPAGTWHQLTNLDTPTSVMLYLDSSDVVIAAFEPTSPASTSDGILLAENAINQLSIPEGKSCWLKLASGAADVTYSQFDGIEIDLEKCAYAVTDGISVDDVVANTFPRVGFDDSAADQLTHIGLLHTKVAGLPNTATIVDAAITLQIGLSRVGRTLRIYGIEEASSITSGLTDYASLASGQTLTTAFEEVTLDATGYAVVDLTAILQELLDDTASWSTSSPVQLWIGDNGSSPTSGLDESATLITSGRTSALFVRT